jgi:hypothetical protein
MGQRVGENLRMRWLTGTLAALLSILMVSTSVSASVCDLSCWLRRADSGCHTGGSDMAGSMAAALSMPPDMDMGPGSDESMTVSTTPGATVTTPGNLVSISTQMRMSMPMFAPAQKVTGRFEYAAKAEAGADSMPGHSKTISSCSHEPCAQIWGSTSPPPGAGRRQVKSQHSTTMSISRPASVSLTFQQICIKTSPPELLAIRPLVTSLRI